jgi:3-oxoacyl-[acyl-carrier protein] reductase
MTKTIVLGGSRGIGAAITKRLSLIENNEVFSYSSDLDTGNLEQISSLVDTHEEVDILVLNTGGPPAIDFFDIDEETWQKYHNQLFLGFCKLLQGIHVKNNGYVFLISSFNIKEPNPKLVLSNAYRMAFVSVFKSLSKLLASRKVSFINIAPGPIHTDRLESLVEDLDKLAEELPMKYLPEPDEIGRFVSAIVEKEIKYLSGVTINFDGAASNYVL